ncbi:MAG: AbrB/MazE/SpoVT family DNA-binding domain-containing protein [Nanoarchaeota archaeon]
MKLMNSTTPDGVPYSYFACPHCGEEVLDRSQLHEVAENYKTLYRAKLSKWGKSIGLRIPKELIDRYGFKGEVTLIPLEKGVKIVP